MRKFFTALVCFLFSVLPLFATDFYVATNGSDSAAGSISAPFLTLTKAQSAQNAAGTNISHIYLRGGDYYNVTMFLQGAAGGAGHDDSGVQWIGYPGDPPVTLWGGQPLTGWQQISNGWWMAYLPPYPSGALNGTVNTLNNWEVRSLYVDGVMAKRARYPATGFLSYTNAYTQTDLTYINYNPGDLPTSMVTGAVTTNMEVQVDWSFDSQFLQVSNINTSTRLIRFVGQVWSQRGLQFIPDIQTYHVENTTEGMTQQGQFYWDKTAQAVIYNPIGGKNPNNSKIIAGTTSRMWFFFGYAGNQPPYGTGPHDITFSNLNMKVAAADVELEGTLAYLLDYSSLIQFYPNCGPNNITVQNCTLGWTAGNAIGGDYGGPTNVMVRDSEIGFCGGYGVSLKEDAYGAGLTTISNNYIHDCGQITPQAPGINVNTNATVVRNNLFNFPEAAVADSSGADNCRYVLNNFSNCMSRNEDLGAFYQYFGNSVGPAHTVGNLIQSNLFQIVGTNINATGGDPRNFFRPAIYLDEQSSNTIVDHNITLGCPMAVLCNIARSNAFQNNIFVGAGTNTGTYVGLRFYLSSDSSLPNKVVGNVFYSLTNLLCDNSNFVSSWGGNVAYSADGVTNGIPAGMTIANPLLCSLTYGDEEFLGASPAIGLGIAPVTLVPVPGGNGVQGFIPAPTNGDPIMPSTLYDPGWPYTGIPGDIPPQPTGTNVLNVKNSPYNAFGDGIHNDTLAISNACNDACARSTNNNQFQVFLPPGNYLVTPANLLGEGSACFAIPNGFPTLYPQVDICGAAPGLTTISISNSSSGGTTGFLLQHGTSTGSYFNIVGGELEGSTNLILTGNLDFHVGSVISITQSNDPAYVTITTLSATSPFTNGNPCTYCGESGQKCDQEFVTVTGLTAAGGGLTNVGIWPPLKSNFEPLFTPQAQRYDMMTNCGVRNLTITRLDRVASDAGYNIKFYGVQGGYVTNVESAWSQGPHIELNDCYHARITYNIIHDGASDQSGENYGVRAFEHSSGHLIDNNIMENLRHDFVGEGGGSDIVVAYNHETNVIVGANPTTFLSRGNLAHGSHVTKVLFQGNNAPNDTADLYHGSSSQLVSFRENFNTISWVPPNQVDAVSSIGAPFYGAYVTNQGGFVALMFSAFSHSNAAIACVTQPTILLATNATVGPLLLTNSPSGGWINQNQPMVLMTGYSDDIPLEGASHAPVDPVTALSFYYHGNWDPINGTIWRSDNSDHAPPNSLWEKRTPWMFVLYQLAWPATGPDLSPMHTPIPAEVRYKGWKQSHNPNWQPPGSAWGAR